MSQQSFRPSRRSLLQAAAATAFAGSASLALGRSAMAQAGELSLTTWSAAVDVVKSHLAAFEKKTGLSVGYSNMPWAQYREGIITKFVGKAPLDVMWVSDSWLPEWADAGWITPIDEFKNLTAYNADAEDFCNASMTYKGHQYGLTYYTDYMAFLYNEDLLKKAGIAAPPATWAEVVEQSKKIQAAGLSQYPMMLGMAQESWLIEFMSAMVFSCGGRFIDEKGNAAMASAKDGATQALKWLVDAVNSHKIISPACVETGELAGLKAFGAGQHAFALLPKYRLRMLNDPAQAAIAGHARQALMPQGENGSHATVGWMRFHGMGTHAKTDKTRAANAAKLIEWFGGKADGEYKFQKLLFLDIGAGFGVKSLFQDPAMREAYSKYSDIDMIAKQQGLARKKDVITTWFGEWNDVNGAAWQQAILGKSSVAEALKKSADKWTELKKQA